MNTRSTTRASKPESSELTAPSTAAPAFSKSWQDWLALNLKRGVPQDVLLGRMVARGFDRSFCVARIAECLREPAGEEGLIMAERRGISFDRAPPFVEVAHFLSDEEIRVLLSAAENMNLRPGAIADGIEDKSIRNSAIDWIDFGTVYPQIAARLTKQIVEINRCNYLFNITEPLTMVQLSRYEQGAHYDFHQDIGRGAAKMRKLTCVVQLSENYRGGELELFFGTKPKAVSRAAGTLIVFPSYTLHRVAPVTSGARVSLVCWSLGPPFS